MDWYVVDEKLCENHSEGSFVLISIVNKDKNGIPLGMKRLINDNHVTYYEVIYWRIPPSVKPMTLYRDHITFRPTTLLGMFTSVHESINRISKGEYTRI